MAKDAKTPLLPSNVESSTKPKRMKTAIIFGFGILIIVLMSLSYWNIYYHFKLQIGDSTYLCSDGRCTSPAVALVIASVLLFVVAPVLLFVVALVLLLVVAPVLLFVVALVLLLVVALVLLLVVAQVLLFVVAPVLLLVVAQVLLFVVALAPVLLLVVGPVLLMVVPFVYSDYFYDHFHDFKIYEELGK